MVTFDERERKQIHHAYEYATMHAQAGVPGHSQFILIAKLQALVEQRTREKDGAYAERNKCLVLMARMAQELGLKVGVGLHVGNETEGFWDPHWRNVLYIDLPSGQVSWHIHDDEAQMFYFVGAYDGEYDGHTTEEKYRRVLEPGL